MPKNTEADLPQRFGSQREPSVKEWSRHVSPALRSDLSHHRNAAQIEFAPWLRYRRPMMFVKLVVFIGYR